MICFTSLATLPWFPVFHTAINWQALNEQEEAIHSVGCENRPPPPCFIPASKSFARDYFPSKIHSALPSENLLTYFLWRRIPGEISEPEPTAKHFLENVSECPVQHDPNYYPSVAQRDT